MRIGSREKVVRVACAAGFTLVELMVVCAIVAILAAISYPSYVTYITKSRRVAAEACVAQYANYMERYYTSNLAYDKTSVGVANTLPTGLGCATTAQTGDYYSYQFPTSSSSLGPSVFAVQAIPKGIQATRDSACGTLSLDQAGGRAAAGTDCW